MKPNLDQKHLGDWSCECWRWRDILGCRMVIGGSGFATSQRWKAGTRGKRPSELRAVSWMHEGSQIRDPVWFSALHFLLLLFKRKSSLFPPSQLLLRSHGCHWLSASSTGQRRLKDQDQRPVMGTEPLPSPTLHSTEGWSFLQTFVTNEMTTGLPNVRAKTEPEPEINTVWVSWHTHPPARHYWGCGVLSPLPVTGSPRGKQMIKNDSNSEWEGEIRQPLSKYSKKQSKEDCHMCPMLL